MLIGKHQKTQIAKTIRKMLKENANNGRKVFFERSMGNTNETRLYEPS